MNTLVLGRRGLGKTTLAVWRGKLLNKHIIAWSPGAQFAKQADFRTYDLPELLDYIDESEEESTYLAEYIPDAADDLNEQFVYFGQALWRYGDFALIVDEAEELQSPAQINPMLNKYIRQAPRREKGEADAVDIIQTSHFPVDFHKVSFGLSDEYYLFRLKRDLDYERIEKEFGLEIRSAVEMTKTPQTDPPGRDVVYIHGDTNEYEVMTDPALWNTAKKKPPTDITGKDKQEEYGRGMGAA